MMGLVWYQWCGFYHVVFGNEIFVVILGCLKFAFFISTLFMIIINQKTGESSVLNQRPEKWVSLVFKDRIALINKMLIVLMTLHI